MTFWLIVKNENANSVLLKVILQFSSLAQACPTLCESMNRSTPGLPVHHQLPEFTQTQTPSSPWCHPAILSSVVPFSSCPQSLPASESFPMSQLFVWSGSRDSSRFLYTHVHSGVIHHSQKQPKYPLTDKWINKMCYIHTVKYYSALKIKEILSCGTSWMLLEDISQGEIGQSQSKVPRIAKFIKKVEWWLPWVGKQEWGNV